MEAADTFGPAQADASAPTAAAITTPAAETMVLDGAGAADATPAAAAGAGAASSSMDTSTMTVQQLQEKVKQLQDRILKQLPAGYRVARSLTSFVAPPPPLNLGAPEVLTRAIVFPEGWDMKAKLVWALQHEVLIGKKSAGCDVARELGLSRQGWRDRVEHFRSTLNAEDTASRDWKAGAKPYLAKEAEARLVRGVHAGQASGAPWNKKKITGLMGQMKGNERRGDAPCETRPLAADVSTHDGWLRGFTAKNHITFKAPVARPLARALSADPDDDRTFATEVLLPPLRKLGTRTEGYANMDEIPLSEGAQKEKLACVDHSSQFVSITNQELDKNRIGSIVLIVRQHPHKMVFPVIILVGEKGRVVSVELQAAFLGAKIVYQAKGWMDQEVFLEVEAHLHSHLGDGYVATCDKHNSRLTLAASDAAIAHKANGLCVYKGNQTHYAQPIDAPNGPGKMMRGAINRLLAQAARANPHEPLSTVAYLECVRHAWEEVEADVTLVDGKWYTAAHRAFRQVGQEYDPVTQTMAWANPDPEEQHYKQAALLRMQASEAEVAHQLMQMPMGPVVPRPLTVAAQQEAPIEDMEREDWEAGLQAMVKKAEEMKNKPKRATGVPKFPHGANLVDPGHGRLVLQGLVALKDIAAAEAAGKAQEKEDKKTVTKLESTAKAIVTLRAAVEALRKFPASASSAGAKRAATLVKKETALAAAVKSLAELKTAAAAIVGVKVDEVIAAAEKEAQDAAAAKKAAAVAAATVKKKAAKRKRDEEDDDDDEEEEPGPAAAGAPAEAEAAMQVDAAAVAQAADAAGVAAAPDGDGDAAMSGGGGAGEGAPEAAPAVKLAKEYKTQLPDVEVQRPWVKKAFLDAMDTGNSSAADAAKKEFGVLLKAATEAEWILDSDEWAPKVAGWKEEMELWALPRAELVLKLLGDGGRKRARKAASGDA